MLNDATGGVYGTDSSIIIRIRGAKAPPRVDLETAVAPCAADRRYCQKKSE
jgi:hypothetical protein